MSSPEMAIAAGTTVTNYDLSKYGPDWVTKQFNGVIRKYSAYDLVHAVTSIELYTQGDSYRGFYCETYFGDAPGFMVYVDQLDPSYDELLWVEEKGHMCAHSNCEYCTVPLEFYGE